MSWLLSNPTKPYIDAAKTDVMRTWRKHGFIPPSELKGHHNAMENMQQVQNQQASLPIQCPQRG